MAALEAAQKQWQEIQKRTTLNTMPPKLTAELSTAVENRQKLEAQLQENISVEKVPDTLFFPHHNCARYRGS
jgi:hypothetical protein